MRILLSVLAAVLVVLTLTVIVTPRGFARTVHRTHIADTRLDTEFRFVRTHDGAGQASFRRSGVRYETADSKVLVEIEATLAELRTRETDESVIEQKTYEALTEIMERAADEGKASKR